MIAYIVMFAIPLIGMALGAVGSRQLSRLAWVGAGLTLILIIGTRRYVGADWSTYAAQFYANANQSLFEAWQSTDIAYATVSWLVYRSGLEIYGVNLICAAILVIGVMAFAARQQDPWLALLVAIPYTLLVVGMGYTRQSAALGLELFALMALADRRLMGFGVYAIAAILFHKSAIILLPLIVLVNAQRPVLTGVVLVGTTVAGSWFAAYSADFDVLRSTYIDQRLSSDGTLARLMIASVAAVGFILIARSTPLSSLGRRVLLALSLATLILLSLSWTSSTAIDRIALYLFPVQMAFWGNFLRTIHPPQLAMLPRMACIAAYGAVMFIWLGTAYHALFWKPYDSFLPLAL